MFQPRTAHPRLWLGDLTGKVGLFSARGALNLDVCSFYIRMYAVLAVGRSDSSVDLLAVEDGRTIHTHTFASPITSLQWMMQDENRYTVFREVFMSVNFHKFLS